MDPSTSHGGLRSAAVFCLCALFAVLAMGLTLLSSGVYRSTAEDSDANYAQRTSLSYLVNQVRRADGAGLVSVGTFGGSDALALIEELDNARYVTLLYCYEGQLRELYTEAGPNLAPLEGVGPGDGIAILALESLTLEQKDGLVRITVTGVSGTRDSVSLSPRCGILTEEVAQ